MRQLRTPPAGEKIAELTPPPRWIKPCLPTLVDRPPVGPEWRHEVKWNGYRVCVVIGGGSVVVRTEDGHDWTRRFKAIAAAASELPCQNAVLDGQAVVLNQQGHSSFNDLQTQLDGESRDEVVLCAFDLLFLDGRDLRPLTWAERRDQLAKLIGHQKTGAIRLSREFNVAGETFFKVASQRGLGMVSKRIDLPYRSGGSSDWLKVKCVRSDDADALEGARRARAEEQHRRRAMHDLPYRFPWLFIFLIVASLVLIVAVAFNPT